MHILNGISSLAGPRLRVFNGLRLLRQNRTREEFEKIWKRKNGSDNGGNCVNTDDEDSSSDDLEFLDNVDDSASLEERKIRHSWSAVRSLRGNSNKWGLAMRR